MNQNIVSAVFDSRSEAEAAIGELRSAGIDSGKLSLIGRDGDGTTVTTVRASAPEKVLETP